MVVEYLDNDNNNYNDNYDFDSYIRRHILKLVDDTFDKLYNHDFITYNINYGEYSNASVNVYYNDSIIACSTYVPNIIMIFEAKLIPI